MKLPKEWPIYAGVAGVGVFLLSQQHPAGKAQAPQVYGGQRGQSSHTSSRTSDGGQVAAELLATELEANTQLSEARIQARTENYQTYMTTQGQEFGETTQAQEEYAQLQEEEQAFQQQLAAQQNSWWQNILQSLPQLLAGFFSGGATAVPSIFGAAAPASSGGYGSTGNVMLPVGSGGWVA